MEELRRQNFSGVKVEIISNGAALQSYNDPDESENKDARTSQCYVEAVTGARFEVKVTLTSDFNMHYGDGARISFHFDDQKDRHSFKIRARSRTTLGFKPCLLRKICTFCTVTDSWRSSYLSFGKLNMS